MSVTFKTTQAGALKYVFDTLKDLIQDANLNFTEEGGTLSAVDNSQCALIYLRLNAEEINKSGFYECNQSACVGFSIPGMHKILKTVKDNDTLTMRLIPGWETRDKLFIESENREKRKKGEFEVPLLDIDDNQMEMNNQEYDSIVTFDSGEFQQTLKDLSCVEGDVVRIESSEYGICLTCTGYIGTASFLIGKKEVSCSSQEQNQHQHHVVNDYLLKFLQVFAKATKLSYEVRIHLKEDYPIVIEYDIPCLGLLRFVLVPRMSEDEPITKPTKKMKNLEAMMKQEQELQEQKRQQQSKKRKRKIEVSLDADDDFDL